MIRFFASLRKKLLSKGKLGSYSKYAFGEIVLVVIGILIALQINNWNEARKIKIQEKVILNKFLQDLQSDMKDFELNINYLNLIDELHKTLYKIDTNKADSISIEYPNYIRRSLLLLPIARDNNPDIVSQVGDKDLSSAIQSYFRLMTRTEGSNQEFKSIVLSIREFLRDNEIHNTSAWFNAKYVDIEKDIAAGIVSEEALKKLARNGPFMQMVFESSLKLHQTHSELEKLMTSGEDLIGQIQMYLND